MTPVFEHHALVRFALVSLTRSDRVQVLETRVVDRPKPAVIRVPAGQLEPGPIPVILVHGKQLRITPHVFSDLPGLEHRVGQGLLTDDVDLGVAGDAAMFAVQPRRGQDVNEIRPLPFEQFSEVAVHASARRKFRPPILCLGQSAVAERDDLHLRNAIPRAQVVLGDHAAAE
jgi:hypothetical protein